MSHFKVLAPDERAVVQRMVDQQELYVEVVDWGFHPDPQITFRNKVMIVRFPMVFDRPQGFTIPVKNFHLKLKDRSGNILASAVESTYVDYQPLPVTAGMQIDLEWAIEFHKLPKDFLKKHQR